MILMEKQAAWLAALQTLGPSAPAVFILVYALAAVLLFPCSLLTLGAGFLFGILKGFALVSIASTLGALGAFLIGRYAARDWVKKRLSEHPSFAAVDEAVGREGWKIVFLTRLSPIFPYNLLNYALGLTAVPLSHYALASWIGMMPGTLLYVYLGSLAGDLASLGAVAAQSPARRVAAVVGLAATAAVVVFVSKTARRALDARLKLSS